MTTAPASAGVPRRLAPAPGARTAAWRLATGATHALARPTSRSRALPGFLVAGAQRAGTTSLFEYLASHPAVVAPRLIKGAHYFDLHYDRDLGWYRAFFPTERRLARVGEALGTRALTGEGSPYYMVHPTIPARIARHLPGVKVIVVLRDPVRRAWSQYQHERARGYEHLPFEEALAREEDRLAGEVQRLLADPAYVSFSHIHHSYVTRGRYLEQLQRLWAALGREAVLVLEFQQLEQDPQGTFDRVTDFLGVPRHRLRGPVAHNARRYAPLEPRVAQQLAERLADANAALRAELGCDWGWTAP